MEVESLSNILAGDVVVVELQWLEADITFIRGQKTIYTTRSEFENYDTLVVFLNSLIETLGLEVLPCELMDDVYRKHQKSDYCFKVVTEME